MPMPIKPIHQLEKGSELFDMSYLSAEGVSSLQAQFMSGAGAPVREAARRFSDDMLNRLESIYSSPQRDDELTVATALFSAERDDIYRVPTAVSDYELLGLKTEGLVRGSGRAVAITEVGKKALAGRWLAQGNELKAARSKEQFIHPANPKARCAGRDSEEILAEKEFSQEFALNAFSPQFSEAGRVCMNRIAALVQQINAECTAERISNLANAASRSELIAWTDQARKQVVAAVSKSLKELCTTNNASGRFASAADMTEKRELLKTVTAFILDELNATVLGQAISVYKPFAVLDFS